jgi:ubiquinone/menaquinone biosynthesis C-methylase UbiE
MSDAELERIRSAYSERDAGHETPYRWNNPGYVAYMQTVERALLAAVADARAPLAGARVLDVGCGSGYFLHRLREYGAGDCHGIDLMESRIAEGRERYPTLELHVGSATELPFEAGRFDLVTQFTCLSSIVDADVRLAVAQEMQRVAAGGWVLSLDMRSGGAPAGGTPTAGVDERELRRLFGEPALLRRVLPRFDLAQRAGRHDLVLRALATLPPLRGHYLGLWRVSA